MVSHDGSLAARNEAWRLEMQNTEADLRKLQVQIDHTAFDAYGFDDSDRASANVVLVSAVTDEADASEGSEDQDGLARQEPQTAFDFLSYSLGCVFGRWDVRYASRQAEAPKLEDPFAPLPACSPGMLQDQNGIPLLETPSGYPLRIDRDGILVDDADHADDVVRRVRDVITVIFKAQAEAIEQDLCGSLGLDDLREHFRRSGTGGFWMSHVHRYSKSRRKAPIYWLLQSSRRNYAIWLYYYSLDKDILFKARLNYVEPKVRLEEDRLKTLHNLKESAGTSGRAAKQLEKDIDKQQAFVSELHDFRDKLKHIADLNLVPDLNDGVVLNIAPLRELVPWREPEEYWNELKAGKYEWSSIAKQLREKELVK